MPTNQEARVEVAGKISQGRSYALGRSHMHPSIAMGVYDQCRKPLLRVLILLVQWWLQNGRVFFFFFCQPECKSCSGSFSGTLVRTLLPSKQKKAFDILYQDNGIQYDRGAAHTTPIEESKECYWVFRKISSICQGKVKPEKYYLPPQRTKPRAANSDTPEKHSTLSAEKSQSQL